MDMRTAAIIPVAGLSSRMGDFKPLMTLDGDALIRLTVRSALDGGVDEVCVILGREGEAVRAALHAVEAASVGAERRPPGPRISFVTNHDFATTDMLRSIQLGLRSLLAVGRKGPLDAVFILPGDIPAIRPSTFGRLRSCAADDGSSLVYPTYRGKKGHPLLCGRDCFETILGYGGEGGLGGAVEAFSSTALEIDDEGTLLDADDPRAFARLSDYVRRIRGGGSETDG
jgi:CTP:molybdopterin cytidylyltransferase MocA